MPEKIVIDGLSEENIANAIAEVRKYQAWVTKKEAELRSRLASLGAAVAAVHFETALYDGVNDVSVRADDEGDTAVIYAEGKAVAFIEFGSGSATGYGHPNPVADGRAMGPGTWSLDPDVGKGHWDNPDGWYYEHGKKSHGNPPAMAMYHAVQEMVGDITKIAREVFSS